MARKLLHEAGTLTVPVAGSETYPVRIINEGVGSSGVYNRALFTPANAKALENSLSFMNHPLDPEKPHLRPPGDIAGRLVGAVEAKEVDGLMGFYGDFKPNPERAAFIAEYADVLGLSVYIGAEFDVVNGQHVVESFDGKDPYKSVDIVVAAGRGGRFERATEAYKSIESSSDTPEGKAPDATSAQDQKEGTMDEKILKALEALTTQFAAFVTESKEATAKPKATEAEAPTPEAIETAVTTAIEAYEVAAKAIADAELLPSQAVELLAMAKAGKDITAPLESATKIVAEAKTQVATNVGIGRVTESASTGSFAVEGMRV